MTWVKVCGLRTRDDVETAIEAGADAIGLVLAESPRRVSLEFAAELIGVAGRRIESFLVTVDLGPDELEEALDASGATGVQPHGRNRRRACSWALERGVRVLHPVAADDVASLADLPTGQMALVDTPSTRHGGTGRTFDWRILTGIAHPFVLAGGLGPHNVERAVREVRPWGVDASTHLESRPGVKDPDAIRAYVRGARRA